MPAEPVAVIETPQAPFEQAAVTEPQAPGHVCECSRAETSAAVRRAEEGRPVRRHGVQFAAPEIDPGDSRLFGFRGTDDGEPSGQYIENLTSLVPQQVEPEQVVATAHQAAPFSMQRQQGGGQAATPVRQQMIQGEPVQLERTGRQNLIGIDEDVDLPPFLRR